MANRQNQPVSIRLDEAFLGRLDKIAAALSQPGLRVTRLEALRLAAHRGADELEAEHADQIKKGRAPR